MGMVHATACVHARTRPKYDEVYMNDASELLAQRKVTTSVQHVQRGGSSSGTPRNHTLPPSHL